MWTIPKGVCLLLLPSLVKASLFSAARPFSPSPISTNVRNSSWSLYRDLDVDDEEHDGAILQCVLQSMREYSKLLHDKQRARRKKRDEEVVCYKDLGCFRDNGAFDYLDILPSPPEEVGTKFQFYSRRSGDVPQTHVYLEGQPLELPVYNGSIHTKIIIHGFGSSCSRLWVHDMRKALLTTLDCNVICVDWTKGATTPNYMRASANTQLVGRQVAILIKDLVNRYNSPLDKIHLIGFSLGAHVSGFAGNELNGSLSRITGLDPAGPLFEGYPPGARLDPTDAQFVDVIHSNGESLLRGGLGTYEQLGHVDFYPNGGRMQKGCTNLFLGAFSDLIWSGSGDGRSLCNHRRSYRFFIDSISPLCPFPALPCENYDRMLGGECFPCDEHKDCGNMGYYADRSQARGKLFLITREGEPFCANQNKVTVNGRGGQEGQTYGRVEITLIAAPGINETFPLTSGDGDDISRTLHRILVAHPAITEVKQIQLVYVAYNGWLYTGTSVWAIDRVSITDSFGNSMSYCKRNTILRSGKPKMLYLNAGKCRVSSLRPVPNYWNQDKPATTNSEPPPLDDLSDNQVRSYSIGTSSSGHISLSPPSYPATAHSSPPSYPATAHSFPETVSTSKYQLAHQQALQQHRPPGLHRTSEGTAKLKPPARGDKPVRGPDQLDTIILDAGTGPDSALVEDVLVSESLKAASSPASTTASDEAVKASIGVTPASTARYVSTPASSIVFSSTPNDFLFPEALVTRKGKALSQTQERGSSLVDPPPRSSYYLQYLPPELFTDPTADHVPGPSIVPPSVHSPAGRHGSGRTGRVLRFSFLRHLLPAWESPEKRYIPLREARQYTG